MIDLIKMMQEILSEEFENRTIIKRSNGVIISNGINKFRIRITRNNTFTVRDMESMTLYSKLSWKNVLKVIS